MEKSLIQFRQKISKITTLPIEEVEELSKHVSLKAIKKNTSIVQPGSVADAIYYVHQGVLRTFFAKDGDEITTEFFFAGAFAGAFTSFLRQRETALTIQAVQDCTLLSIKKDILDKFCAQDVRWTLILKHIFETEFVKKCERESSFLLDDAKHRYRKLLDQRPELETVVPLSFIASYLGIQPETLSRLRAQKIKTNEMM